jgi:septal ring factor EnvC (AmiA/AmiB activator)
MFSGQWPEPQVGQVRTELDGRMTPVSEAERREVFLRAIGNDHPLMDLILKCIQNHPQARAHASEIVGRLAEMVLQFPASFANRLDEALRQNEALSRENRELREENRRTEALDKEIQDLRREIERKNREIQEFRTENELLKIEIKTTGLNLQDFSPSQVRLLAYIIHCMFVCLLLLSSQKVSDSNSYNVGSLK